MKIVLFLALLGTLTAFGQSHPAPNEARIAEIAGWLAAEPSAPGARITDRKAWDRFRDAPEVRKMIARAEELAKLDVPDMPPVWYLEYFTTDYIKDGDSRRWREPFWKRARNLQVLVFGECLENKGRFLKRITQYLELMPTECAWTEPAHDRSLSTFNGTRPVVDLGVAERCAVISYALDWLKDRIPASTRNKAIEAIRARAFRPYLSGGENWSCNNWNPVCNGCVVRAALALEPDRMVRARFVEAAERTAPYFLNGFRADGYCGEGLDYWNYGFGRFLPLVLDVRRATGGKVDLGKLPRAKEAMAYAYGFQLEPFVAPRVSDGMANAPSSLNLALGRLIWPDLTCERAERFNPVIPGFDSLSFLALSDDVSRSRASSDNRVLSLPSRTWFSDAQMYFGRPGGSSRVMPFSACLKGGWNGDPHNHNDVGTYVLMLGGVEMVSDPGGEEYTKRTFSPRRYESKILNSYGHPVPVVAGELQKPGTQYAAQVLDTEFSDAADVVKLDLSRAYGLDDSVKVVRTLRYDRTRRSATISDDFKAGKPIAFETAIITFATVERTGDPSTFFLVNATPRRKLKVSISAEGGELAFREERLENPKRRIPTRIGVALAGTAKEGCIRIRYDVVE